ncbi:MAG: hypothetical protein OEY73_04035 [Hadesarchaea archaeon]|nr:hypothetical protein [Hadesarchaea archaeon]
MDPTGRGLRELGRLNEALNSRLTGLIQKRSKGCGVENSSG